MKTKLILIAAAGALLGTLALAPPAEAGHMDWSFGVGFHVGGLDFHVGFAPTGWGGYPGPFFLTTGQLHYPGHACSGACFRRGATFYHHASCPLLSFHLRRGGYGPDYFVHNYSPYRGVDPWYGYRTYRPYRSYRPYGTYGRPYRPYYRDRVGHRPGHHYRDGYSDRHRRHYGEPDHRRRGRDHGRDRGYRDDDRSRRGGSDHAQPRGRAHRTRPPH